MKIALIYHREEENYAKKLRQHLRMLKNQVPQLEVWSMKQLGFGNISDLLQKEIENTDRVLYLLSVDALEEEHLREVLITAQQQGTTVIPILIRSCLYKQEPLVANLVVLPREGYFIHGRNNIDEIFMQIVSDVANSLGVSLNTLKKNQKKSVAPRTKRNEKTIAKPPKPEPNKKRLWAIVLLGLFLVLGYAAVSNWLTKVETPKKNALDLFQDEKTDSLKRTAQTEYDTWLEQGDAELRKSEPDYEKAQSHYKKALATAQNFAEIKTDAAKAGKNKCETEIRRAKEEIANRTKAKPIESTGTELPKQVSIVKKAAKKSKATESTETAPPKQVPPPSEKASQIEMVEVQGGSYTMGCTSEQEGDCYKDWEEPPHTVRVPSFKMGKYEVTQAQWQAVMGSNPSYFKNCPQCPVEQVSWNEVQDFIRKLNTQTGKNYRLPSEAEWEYAARGGNKSKGYKYTGSNNLGDVAWSRSNSGDKTHPVNSKKTNELGLYHMSGNVWEWCEDRWHSNYEGAPTDGRAWQSEKSRIRVLRGGSWRILPVNCRVSYRRGNFSDFRYGTDCGFRLAHSL